MLAIQTAQSGDALDQFIALAHEYVTWMLAEIPKHYPDLDIQTFAAEHDYADMRHKFPGEHRPPDGCLLIALDDKQVYGCVALGRLTPEIGELRTLYVRPAGRGMGVGKQLVSAALAGAQQLGYTRIRLDTLGFMTSAQQLYRSLGFYDIPAYNALPADLAQYICFLEKTLP